MVTKHEKQLLTLLAACVKDDNILGNIVLHRISTGSDYQLVKNLDDYSCLTEQGISIYKRAQQFILPESASYSTACNLDSELNKTVTELKQLQIESEKNAGISINEPYQPVHIIEKGRLSDLIRDKKRALEATEGYQVWKERNNYVYRNEAASQLKKDMDTFSWAESSLEEIHASYAILNTFRNRFEENKREIITVETNQKQRKKQATDNLFRRMDNIFYTLLYISGLIVVVSGYVKDKLWGGFYTLGAEILAGIALVIALNIVIEVIDFMGSFFTKNQAQRVKFKTILSKILMIPHMISWFIFLDWFATKYKFSWTWLISLYKLSLSWMVSFF
jgi:hypothetical protein